MDRTLFLLAGLALCAALLLGFSLMRAAHYSAVAKTLREQGQREAAFLRTNTPGVPR